MGGCIAGKGRLWGFQLPAGLPGGHRIFLLYLILPRASGCAPSVHYLCWGAPNRCDFCLPGDIWQIWETFLVVITGRKWLLASGGWEAEVLLNMPQSSEWPPEANAGPKCQWRQGSQTDLHECYWPSHVHSENICLFKNWKWGSKICLRDNLPLSNHTVSIISMRCVKILEKRWSTFGNKSLLISLQC